MARRAAPSRPVRTVFFGSGPFGLPALERLAARSDVGLVAVVSTPPRPAGRHGRPTPTPIALWAAERGLAVLTPPRLRSREATGAILALEPELAVLADYGQLVPAELLELPFGALNLHPSLLPRHRGAAPIPAAILAGDRETGVTIFRMDAGLDTGPVLARRAVPIAETETAESLERRLAIVAAQLLDEVLGPWLRGEIEAEPQPAEGATATRRLRREDGWLDPARPAEELERRVRALRPWPGAFLETELGRLIVHAATAEPSAAGDEPGRLVASGDGLALTTAAGRLRLLLVQPAGGRVMTAAEYRRGRPRLVGTAVGRPAAVTGAAGNRTAVPEAADERRDGSLR